MAHHIPQPATYYNYDYYHGINGTSHYGQGYTWDIFGPLFTGLARLIATVFPMAGSVLDCGAATGLLVRALRTQGLEAWGVDHSTYCLEHADPLARPYLTQGSLETLAGLWTSDVVTVCETLEHLSVEQLAAALPRLRAHATQGLFATIPCADMRHKAAWRAARREPSHCSLYPSAWWYEQFAAAGFMHGVVEEMQEQYCREDALVRQVGWEVFCFSI